MRAPIRHDAVTAVRTISFAAIADDRVIRDSHGRFINYRERWIRRLQPCDTVRKTFGTSCQLHQLGAGERVLHGIKQLEWKPDQADAKATQSAAGHVTSPMWCANKYNAMDSRIRPISHSANDKAVT